jgi:hypothetical protein
MDASERSARQLAASLPDFAKDLAGMDDNALTTYLQTCIDDRHDYPLAKLLRHSQFNKVKLLFARGISLNNYPSRARDSGCSPIQTTLLYHNLEGLRLILREAQRRGPGCLAELWSSVLDRDEDDSYVQRLHPSPWTSFRTLVTARYAKFFEALIEAGACPFSPRLCPDPSAGAFDRAGTAAPAAGVTVLTLLFDNRDNERAHECARVLSTVFTPVRWAAVFGGAEAAAAVRLQCCIELCAKRAVQDPLDERGRTSVDAWSCHDPSGRLAVALAGLSGSCPQLGLLPDPFRWSGHDEVYLDTKLARCVEMRFESVGIDLAGGQAAAAAARLRTALEARGPTLWSQLRFLLHATPDDCGFRRIFVEAVQANCPLALDALAAAPSAKDPAFEFFPLVPGEPPLPLPLAESHLMFPQGQSMDLFLDTDAALIFSVLDAAALSALVAQTVPIAERTAERIRAERSQFTVPSTAVSSCISVQKLTHALALLRCGAPVCAPDEVPPVPTDCSVLVKLLSVWGDNEDAFAVATACVDWLCAQSQLSASAPAQQRRPDVIPLLEAVMQSRFDLAQLLLDKSASVFDRNRSGSNLLMVAETTEAAQWVLERMQRASLERTRAALQQTRFRSSMHLSPLYFAVSKSDVRVAEEMVRLYLDAGARVEHPIVLARASRKGSDAVIFAMLLARGLPEAPAARSEILDSVQPASLASALFFSASFHSRHVQLAVDAGMRLTLQPCLLGRIVNSPSLSLTLAAVLRCALEHARAESVCAEIARADVRSELEAAGTEAASAETAGAQ